MQTNKKKTYFLHPTGRQPPKHLKNITSAVYGLAQGICIVLLAATFWLTVMW